MSAVVLRCAKAPTRQHEVDHTGPTAPTWQYDLQIIQMRGTSDLNHTDLPPPTWQYDLQIVTDHVDEGYV